MSPRPLEPIPTRVGHASHGDNLFWGHSVGDELAGRISLSGLLVMAVTGRWLSREDAELLDDVVTVNVAADPRIWPLKAASLVASYGHAVAGLAAGHLVFLSQTVGPLTAAGAAWLLVRLRESLGDDREVGREGDAGLRAALKALRATGRRVPGIGVPFRAVDERVVALRARVRARGRGHGPFWRLFERVDEASIECFGVRPNVSLGFAAVMLDLGVEPESIGVLGVMLMAPNFLAVASEAAERASPLMQSLPEEQLAYVGRPARQSPRMSRADCVSASVEATQTPAKGPPP